MLRISSLLLLILLALWLFWPQRQETPLRVFGPEAEVRVLSRPDLSGAALKALSVDMAQSSYFGAFAVGPSGRFGWTGERHDMATARFGALERCGAGCRVIVEVWPKGEAAGRTVSHALSQAVQGRAGAFDYALAPNGAWGLGAEALARCRGHLTPRAADCVLFHGPLAP